MIELSWGNTSLMVMNVHLWVILWIILVAWCTYVNSQINKKIYLIKINVYPDKITRAVGFNNMFSKNQISGLVRRPVFVYRGIFNHNNLPEKIVEVEVGTSCPILSRCGKFCF